jgi:hypothetical protein
MKNKMKIIIPALLFLAVIAVFVTVYITTRPKPSEETAGAKKITVLVVVPDQETKEFTIQTDADFLRQALDQEKLIGGNEGEFGFYITEVNKIKADDSKQQWWCITKRGEEIFYGVDEILIMDGDQYELTLKTGY